MTLSLWTLGLLLISLTGTHGLSQFPEKFVVVKMDDPTPVTLTCPVSNEDVTWKMNDDLIVNFDPAIEQDGPILKVNDVGTPLLGKYSCWSGGKIISSTYLLQEDEAPEEFDSLISCWAKSYNCIFNCTWNSSEYTAVRLGLGSNCSEGRESCQWVRIGDLGQFELSHSLNPYAEESTMLELTAEVTDHLFFSRMTKRFYLRDIIQPDSPNIVSCQVLGQKLNVTIDPPSSWSTPHSFFSLEHEIEYILRDDGKIGSSLSTLIPKSISKMRARSRDSLVLSNWSLWTPWKNVWARKKKKAKQNRVELPPGYMRCCRKKGKKPC